MTCPDCDILSRTVERLTKALEERVAALENGGRPDQRGGEIRLHREGCDLFDIDPAIGHPTKPCNCGAAPSLRLDQIEADAKRIGELEAFVASVEKRLIGCSRYAGSFAETHFVGCKVFHSSDPNEWCIGCEARALLERKP